MDDFEIVDSSFTAIVNAPLDRIDIPTWCFNLSAGMNGEIGSLI